jgi:hypothetical protein
MTVQTGTVGDTTFYPLTRHLVDEDGTHFLFPYEGNFTESKSDMFGDNLLYWRDSQFKPMDSRWIARTYASTSDRWKNMKLIAVDEDTVLLTADGVKDITLTRGKAIFL